MCRLYAFLSLEPMRVECALVRAQNSLFLQSGSDSTHAGNLDGWGIAYYAGSTPRIVRRGRAAFQDLEFLTDAHEIQSRIVVAHVRRGTTGSATEENAHPFRVGRWVFAHNDGLPHFEKIGPILEAEVGTDLVRERIGQTDSELLFLWILTRIREEVPQAITGGAPLEASVRAVRCAVDRLVGLCRADGVQDLALNFVLTDGAGLVASRYHRPLFVLERDRAFVCEVCRECHCHHCVSDEAVDAASHGSRAIVVASEPITDEAWTEVPEGSILGVTRQAVLQRLALPGVGKRRR